MTSWFYRLNFMSHVEQLSRVICTCTQSTLVCLPLLALESGGFGNDQGMTNHRESLSLPIRCRVT